MDILDNHHYLHNPHLHLFDGKWLLAKVNTGSIEYKYLIALLYVKPLSPGITYWQ